MATGIVIVKIPHRELLLPLYNCMEMHNAELT
jgi:hypothetical protein